jgi:predicted nucleotidyltransferase
VSIRIYLSKDLREFVELLNGNGVEFLVVGAHAVAWHGNPRFTNDIDFFVRKGLENGTAIVRTLAQFGFASLGMRPEDFLADDQILQLGQKPNRIDVITSIAGVSFDEAWQTRVAGDIDGIAVQFIGLTELLRNKESTGRPKDIGDADELRKRHPGA